MNTETKGINMTQGSIPKLLIKFAIPSVLQSVVMVINSLVTAILAGRFIGPEALGAVAISMPIIFVINSVAMGTTQANSILIAQAFGRKDYPELKKIIDTSFILLFAICVFMVTVGISCASLLLHLIQTPPEIFPHAKIFFVLHLVGVPFLFTQFLFFGSFRGLGDSKRPMWLSFLSVAMNICILPLLVTGVFGLPKLGIMGLGISDILANCTIFVIIFIVLKREKSIILPGVIHINFNMSIAKMIIRIAFPSIVQQVLLNASVLFIISLINSCGATVTEGYGVGSRVDGLIFAISAGICGAVSVVAGQNLGVEDYDRVSETCKWAIIFSLMISVIPAFFAIFFPEIIMKCFTTDQGVIEVGCGYLRISGFNCLLIDVLMAMEGIPMAAGQTYITTLVTIIATCLVRVPCAYWLHNTKLGVTGIWLSALIAQTVAIIVIVIYYLSGKWKIKNLISEMENR